MRRLQILLAGGILLLFAAVFGQVSLFPGVRLQGVLKDAGGNPVNGGVTVQVHIYTAPTGGTPLYTETFSRTLSAGILDVILGVGQGTATGDLQAALAATQTEPERWLGIVVNSDPELSPRAMLNSTPHSFRVGTVDGARGGTITGDVNVAGAMNAKNMVLVSPGPIQTPLSIQGSSGQTANLVEIKNSDGLGLASFGATGQLQVSGVLANDELIVLDDGVGTNPTVKIQGSTGQTANLVEVLDPSSVPLLTVGAGGAMNAKNMVLKTPGPSQTPLIIEGAMGQTGNLTEWRLPIAGGGYSTPMKIGPSGDVTTGPLQVDGSVTLNLTKVTQTDCGLTLDKFQSIIIVDYAAVAPDTVCTINLPTAAGIKGRTYTIKRAFYTATPQVVIDPYLDEKIDYGSLRYLFTPGNYVTIVSDGANWHEIAFGNSP